MIQNTQSLEQEVEALMRDMHDVQKGHEEAVQNLRESDNMVQSAAEDLEALDVFVVATQTALSEAEEQQLIQEEAAADAADAAEDAALDAEYAA